MFTKRSCQFKAIPFCTLNTSKCDKIMERKQTVTLEKLSEYYIYTGNANNP